MRITGKNGFHITFTNGYTVSVQFGPGTYSDNHGADFKLYRNPEFMTSNTVECAVWAGDGAMIKRPSFGGDTVGSYMTPEDMLKLMNWAAKQKG
jgi:hypothetical protein